MIKNFVNNHYLVFLFLFVLISYGQILFMQPWQEDNVVFFKMAHINERAGYMGTSMWGEGPYRFIITPYYLLYRIFGYTIPVFYSLAFAAFFLACVALYFLFKKLVSRRAGMLASLLFGAGYVAYDGFVRIYNSTSASLGIIALSSVLIFYWNYYKKRKPIWYICALASYFIAIQLSYIRMHYLILPLFFFEIIFFAFPLKISNVIKSLARTVPFIFIFFNQYVGGDSRERSISELIRALLAGKFENLFSFFSTLGNLFVLDKLQNLVAFKQILVSEVPILILFTSLVYLIIKNGRYRWLITIFSGLVGIVWLFFSTKFYASPSLIYSNPQSTLASFLGGLFLILTLNIIFILKNVQRKLVIFFTIMIVPNIAAYAAYTPLTPYGTGYRYLAHSYVAFIGILVVVTEFASKKLKSAKPIYLYSTLILITFIFGVTNLNSIVVNKSQRISLFYRQLKSSVSHFPKGSILYFDIKDDPIAKSFYAVSFSVAEMPDTTAIAWRYGIDRYDISMFTDFDQFTKEIETNNTPLDKVFTFWVSENGLSNTTDEFRKQISSKTDPYRQFLTPLASSASGESLEINLTKPASSLAPLELSLDIVASPRVISTSEFPLVIRATQNPIYDNAEKAALAFSYKNYKSSILRSGLYTASSQWKERVLESIHDNNPDTVWQADRVSWDKEETFVKIDMKRNDRIKALAWINGYPNNTPTKYSVLASLDDSSWTEVASINNHQKISDSSVQIIDFNPITTRYIKLVIDGTINDSPSISEIWPIPTIYEDMNIGDAEEFVKNPFLVINDRQSYLRNLQSVNYLGEAKIYWKGNKSEKWISSNNSIVNLTYDGKRHTYKITIPQSGTKIEEFKLSDFMIPGTFTVSAIVIK